MLKYSYVQNWESELQENYTALAISTAEIALAADYDVEYEETYSLKYLQDKWMNDFGIMVEIPTHVKMIFNKY